MPMCGFNQEMIEGLTAFHEGLVEYGLIKRAESKGVSIDEVLQKELSDMERFLEITPGLENSDLRMLTESLTNYVKTFYRIVDREGIENYRETVKKFESFYREIDRRFYEDLEGKTRWYEPISCLFEWSENLKFYYINIRSNSSWAISFTESLIKLDSRAKPRPSLPPILKLLTPMTSPCLLINGPPLLPGLREASICM